METMKATSRKNTKVTQLGNGLQKRRIGQQTEIALQEALRFDAIYFSNSKTLSIFKSKKRNDEKCSTCFSILSTICYS